MLPVAGRYDYHRLGYDRRPLELRPDGTIGQGGGTAERRWRLLGEDGSVQLSIAGDHGEICRLSAGTDGTWRGRWLNFERMPIELAPDTVPKSSIPEGIDEASESELKKSRTTGATPLNVPHRNPVANSPRTKAVADPRRSQDVPGRYTYRRVYHDERPMELLSDGTIGSGAAGGERRWELRGIQLEISGDYGLLCRLKRDGDGVWRGNWIDYGRMPVELYPEGAQVPPMPRKWNTFAFPETTGFWWSNYECLGRAVRKLCRQLPPLRAVAGIPRSGLIPASLIAQWQNIPLLDIDEALVSTPRLSTHRRRSAADLDERLPILVVDDTVSSGRTLSWYKSRASVHRNTNYLFGAPYVDRRCRDMVDFAAEDHPQCCQAFEWNLLHEVGHTQITLCDLDGVICEDWNGDEERDPAAYRRHLTHGKPLRLPTMPLLGIVTGRMHIHYAQTQAWLSMCGVKYQQLSMLPAATEHERVSIGPARFKARVYAESPAKLFIESCPAQAKEIHELTKKPVIDFTNMIAHGVSIVR